MQDIEDCRGKSSYTLAEILTGCLAMFLFKAGSRNALHNLRNDLKFCKNYEKLFKLKLPHPDTVDRVMRILDETHLETLKKQMIKILLEHKTLHKYRLQGKWFVVAIDATGESSYDHKHCEHCLHRTSSGGKTTWFHNVLEAKLITANGFALSICTVWIENPEGGYDKQDCERKAFIRLAAKLKEDFPRLPICITADGLYPYKGFFDTCLEYGWRYIVTFKDGNLPSVWEEVLSLKSLQEQNCRREVRIEGQKVKKTVRSEYRWVTAITYNDHNLHWIECVETISVSGEADIRHRFVHLTDLAPNYHNTPELSTTGRLRWKIENEGFNAQKNQGYGLGHKFSRVSYRAMKNYYQCLQIAHIINELLVLSQDFQSFLVEKMTLKHIWKSLQALMSYGDLDDVELEAIGAKPCQIRFVT